MTGRVRRVCRLAAAVLVLVPGLHRVASQEAIPEEIIITAEAPENPPEPGVLRIDAEKAREAGQVTLGDVVSSIPGVVVQRTGSGFETATVRIRGSSTEQVLVLRNGRRLGNSRISSVDLNSISLRDVASIEIYMGPATARFGHGAAAGAINLVTRKLDLGAESFEFSGTVSWLSTGTGTLALSGLFPVGSVQFDVQTGGTLSENDYTFERADTELTRVNAGGHGGYLEIAGVLPVGLRLESGVNTSVKGVPGSVEFPSDTAAMEDTSAALSLSSGRSVDLPRLFGSVTFRYSDRAFSDPGHPLGELYSRTKLTELGGSLEAQRRFADYEATLPFSVWSEFMDASDLGNRVRTVIAFAPTITSSSQRDITWGGTVRAEYATDGGFLPSARLHVGIGSTERGPSLAVSLSTGYRLPSFSDLFMPSGGFAVGNPDLKPETSRGGEVEGKLRLPGRVEARTSGYYILYDDLIQWLPDPNGFWKPRNTGRARSYGIEGSLVSRWTPGLSPWTFESSLSGDIQRTEDLVPSPTEGKELPFRPRFSAHAQFALEHLLGYRIGLEMVGMGERPINAQNTRYLDRYVVFDLAVLLPVPRMPVVFTVRVHNLGDIPYTDTRFYPNPGREYYAAAEVSL